MPDQDDPCLAQGIEHYIFEASLDEGIIRARNDPFDEVQRSVITDRGVTSPYKVQALLKACIHGYMNGASSNPASLIVVDYQLVSLKEGSVFTSVTTSFTFSDCQSPQSDTAQASAGSAPTVVAYAPFELPVRFNQSTATESHKTNPELNIAPEFNGISLGGFKFGTESSSSHEQKYFEQGTAGRHFDGDKQIVWWNLIHNKSQNHGVTPQFRVAVLVERKTDSKFQANFKIAARGGFGYKIQSLKDKWLYKTAIDDPIIFDPARPPMGDLEGIEASELGKLKKRERLQGLSMVPGLEILAQVGN
ncbi:hypothetical protein TWF694_010210 [Orbilia ellipsospora]|uniref:Uncharacterized protein n=1 Tax=Orbilia ellipsospora TaxID=2528407 RepID=A0AAV9XAD5_9PEZI